MAGSMSLEVLVRLRDRLTGPLARLRATLSSFSAAVRRVGLALGAMAVGGIAALTATMAVMGKGVIDTGMQFEKFRAILKTLTGSAAQADKDLAWIQTFSETTPYELAEVTDAFVKLKSYGLDPVNGLLKSTGNMAAAMGKGLDQAVEAVADAMTGENERLKEFGIRASKEGNRITYTFAHQGKEMSIRAKNTSKDIQRALQQIMDLKFAGAMDEQSKTLGGILSNIGDMWTGFQKMIADAGLFDAVKEEMQGVLDQLNAWKKDGTLKEVAREISRYLVTAMRALKGLGRDAFEWARSVDWTRVGRGLLMIGRVLWQVGAAFARAGGAVASFFADLGQIGGGGFMASARGIAEAIGKLVGSLDAGSLAALAAGGGVILAFGLKLARIGGGLPFKLVAIALGLSSLSKMGGEMTAIDWAFAAAGLATLATSLFKVARALKGIVSSAGAGAAIRDATAAAGAASAAGAGGSGAKGGGSGGIGFGRGMATGIAALGLWDMIVRHGERVGKAAAANGGNQGQALAQVIEENRQSQRAFLAPLQSQLDRLYSLFHGAKGETTAGGKESRVASPETIVARPEIVEPIRVEGEAAAQLADAIGSRITDSFSVTATPTVDTSSIDSAKARVDALAAALRALPGTTAPAGGTVPVDGARAAGGPVRRGGLYLVGERGPELFQAGSDGTVHDAATSRKMMERGAPAGFVARGGGDRSTLDVRIVVDGPGKVAEATSSSRRVRVATPNRGRAVGTA